MSNLENFLKQNDEGYLFSDLRKLKKVDFGYPPDAMKYKAI